ncbi:MAG: LysR family transcriptional regulator [Polyangiaceae bacterium]
MYSLNFHHLRLFTTVVREGSLVAAGRVLRLSHSTLSTQLRHFEETLGAKLLERHGRVLVPTSEGKLVFRYGEEIFGLGRELVDGLAAGKSTTARLRVGVVSGLPKLVVHRLLEPLLTRDPSCVIVCFEDSPERMIGRLGLHEVDVVLSDAPAETGIATRAYSHLLGACGVSFFGAPSFASLGKEFPRSLHGAPMLLPLQGSPLRRALNVWFSTTEIRPRIVGEFENSALLNSMARSGIGVFASPAVLEREMQEQYGAIVLGRAPQVIERFFAITLERRIEDPAVARIRDSARDDLFRPEPPRKKVAPSKSGAS